METMDFARLRIYAGSQIPAGVRAIFLLNGKAGDPAEIARARHDPDNVPTVA
jgi:hypothetical protein